MTALTATPAWGQIDHEQFFDDRRTPSTPGDAVSTRLTSYLGKGHDRGPSVLPDMGSDVPDPLDIEAFDGSLEELKPDGFEDFGGSEEFTGLEITVDDDGIVVSCSEDLGEGTEFAAKGLGSGGD